VQSNFRVSFAGRILVDGGNLINRHIYLFAIVNSMPCPRDNGRIKSISWSMSPRICMHRGLNIKPKNEIKMLSMRDCLVKSLFTDDHALPIAISSSDLTSTSTKLKLLMARRVTTYVQLG
jgi:hypothetical protein